MDIKKAVADNLPAILTSIAVTGVIATTVTAVRATPAALRDIWDAEQDVIVDDDRTPLIRSWDRIRIAWPHYIPTVVIGGLTLSAIVSAHSVSTKRQIAIAGLYSLTDKAFSEYREKVVNEIGPKKDKAIRDEIAKEHIEANPVSNNEIIITGNGTHLCYDTISGRYFESNIDLMYKAQNELNAKCINHVYASQNDFYRLIGLPITPYGEEIGWSSDRLMDISFSSHLAEDGRPCLSLVYRLNPIHGYDKIY